MASHNNFCSIFATLYYWASAALLFGQAALAVNRWSLVCTVKYRSVQDIDIEQTWRILGSNK